jgi:hypothetical protein
VRLDCAIFIFSSPVRTSTWLFFLLRLTRLDLAFDEGHCLGRYEKRRARVPGANWLMS